VREDFLLFVDPHRGVFENDDPHRGVFKNDDQADNGDEDKDDKHKTDMCPTARDSC